MIDVDLHKIPIAAKHDVPVVSYVGVSCISTILSSEVAVKRYIS